MDVCPRLSTRTSTMYPSFEKVKYCVLLLTRLDGTEGRRCIGLRLSELRLGARWAPLVNTELQLFYPRTRCTRRWMGLMAGLDGCGDRRFSGLCWDSNPDRPARRKSLNRVSHPGHSKKSLTVWIGYTFWGCCCGNSVTIGTAIIPLFVVLCPCK